MRTRILGGSVSMRIEKSKLMSLLFALTIVLVGFSLAGLFALGDYNIDEGVNNVQQQESKQAPVIIFTYNLDTKCASDFFYKFQIN